MKERGQGGISKEQRSLAVKRADRPRNLMPGRHTRCRGLSVVARLSIVATPRVKNSSPSKKMRRLDPNATISYRVCPGDAIRKPSLGRRFKLIRTTVIARRLGTEDCPRGGIAR